MNRKLDLEESRRLIKENEDELRWFLKKPKLNEDELLKILSDTVNTVCIGLIDDLEKLLPRYKKENLFHYIKLTIFFLKGELSEFQKEWKINDAEMLEFLVDNIETSGYNLHGISAYNSLLEYHIREKKIGREKENNKKYIKLFRKVIQNTFIILMEIEEDFQNSDSFINENEFDRKLLNLYIETNQQLKNLYRDRGKNEFYRELGFVKRMGIRTRVFRHNSLILEKSIK